MSLLKNFFAACLIFSLSGYAFCADVILNEYNAVGGSQFINGGNEVVDDDGGRACDSYFGRVMGNGGDWFELVVITDHLDMRGWKLDIYDSGAFSETLVLTTHPVWSDLRSGTIITVSEDLPSDISYNPAAGDWWINAQSSNDANGAYITASNFVVSNNNWQLRIKNSLNVVMFGPAGEGVSPAGGISDTEIFRLKADPSALITPPSADYGDEKSFSTFSLPNKWGLQDINTLRVVAPAASTITVLSPNASAVVAAGSVFPITWNTAGPVEKVLIEYSIDYGYTWLTITPSAIVNTLSFDWLVPMIDSEYCFIRIINANNPAVYDMSDDAFYIYQCPAKGDLTGDCIVNLTDLAVMVDYWLDCANPYNPQCY